MTDRRTFTHTMVQTVTIAALNNKFAWSKTKVEEKVDTHAHIFVRGLPLFRQRRYVPDYDATLEAYLSNLDQFSMAKGVLIQPSFLGTDNSFLLAALKRHAERLRGVVVIDPETDVPLLRHYNQAGCVGIRLNLIGLPDPDLTTTHWAILFARLRYLNWFVEFQVEAIRLQHLAEQVLREGLKVVVDHFGRPDPKTGVDDPGFRQLISLGKTRNVWIKLSGAYRNGSNGRGEQIALEAMPLLMETFGVDRMLWGSDWPHTQFENVASYESAVMFTEKLLPNPADRHSVLTTTPGSLFRFAQRS